MMNLRVKSGPPAAASLLSSMAVSYSAANNNRLNVTPNAPAGVRYDAAGNITDDGRVEYLYDGDGRICAVANYTVPSMTVMTGYLYDAEGRRVAKGTITAWSCDPTVNGFQTTDDYILGPGGEQVTEMGVGGSSGGTTTSGLVWHHTNVWAAGKLLATYDVGSTSSGGLHFYFDDPLGTRRVQTDSAGNVEQRCSSLPYGDGESCGPTPTEHLFTGKERDSESGNDYFGARYYNSDTGRFLSPDWSAKYDPVPYASLGDPQTLNLYSYVRNNPLASVDPDGHWGNDLFPNISGMSDPTVAAWLKSSNELANQAAAAAKAQQQNSNSASSGTGFWHGLSNLFHGHSWNYVKTSVTTNETYSIAGAILPPGASGTAQAAKAATRILKPTPNPIPIEPVGIPGQSVPPEQTIKPGDLPEIEPGATTFRKLQLGAAQLMNLLGNQLQDFVVCVDCFLHGPNSPDNQMFQTPPED